MKLRIPAPPHWLFIALVLAAIFLAVTQCAQPHRFDPLRQQQAQQQQETCLAKGGNPQQCRP
jgi:hypothetical protein